MDVCVGNAVLVNAAAFIASRFRNQESIPCEVLEIETARVLAKTRNPYRVFTMWISREWIEDTECVTASPSR